MCKNFKIQKNWCRILLVFSFVLFFSCKTDLSKVKQPEDITKRPDLSVLNFEAEYKNDGILQAVAYSPIMNKYIKENYTEFPKGVDVKFFDKYMNVATTLKCKYAINYGTQKLWKFSDSVVIRNSNDGILRTQELYFDQTNEKIYSIKYVEVVDKIGTVIRGKGGFEANYDFTFYEFKNVDGTIALLQSDLE